MSDEAIAGESDKANLVEYVYRSLEDEEEFHFLRFEFLQRINITQLEVKLVRMKSEIQRQHEATPTQLADLTTVMNCYATAIRDYEFLRNHTSLDKVETRRRKLLLQRYFQRPDDFNDPFHSHYSAFEERPRKLDPLRSFLMTMLPARLAFSKLEKRERNKEYMEGQHPKEVSTLVDRTVRFLIAFTGGLFVVAPMIIMSIHPSQTKSLVTVSAAVIIFALLVSFGVRVSNIETLISTATYSAVLVVFVGTSTATGDLNQT